MGTIINRRRACGGKKGLLPSGYVQLEYIENTSNAYIDTGVKPNQDTDIEFSMYWSNVENGCCFVGCEEKVGNTYVCFYEASLDNARIRTRRNTTNGENFYNTAIAKGMVTVKSQGSTTTYTNHTTGMVYTNTLSSYSSFQLTIPMMVFARMGKNIDTVVNFNARFRLFYFNVLQSNTIVRNFIPCKNPNNIVGMYDTVNGVFYSSPNGTAFVAGQEV